MGGKTTNSGHSFFKASGGIGSGSLETSLGLSFESIATKLFELIYTRDLEGIITYMSPQVSSYGYEPKDLIGHNVREFIHPHDVKLVRDKGAGELSYHFRLRKKDGPYFDFEVATVPFLKDGRVDGYIGFIRDITERKKAEEALRESEERHRSIVENSRDVIMLTNPDGKIAYLSPACKSVLGYEPKDLVGKQPWITYEADLAKIRKLHIKALSGQSGACEYRIKTKSKEIRWVSHSWSPVFRDKELRLIVSLVKDITDQKRAEEELTTSQELFRSTLDSMDDLVITLDKKGAILAFHKPHDRATFLDLGSFLNKNHEKVLPQDLAERLKSSIKLASATGNVQHFEHTLHTGGRMGWFSVNVSVRRDAKGEIAGYTLVSRDITERKKAEEKLAKSEKNYRDLLEILNEGILIIEKDAYITFVNPKMAEMLGYSEKEMIGEHMFSFMDEDGMGQMKKLLQRRKKGIREQYDFEFIKKGGGRLYARLGASSILDNDGVYQGSIAGVMDMTEAKRAEEALRKSEEFLRSTICSLRDLLLVINENGLITGYHNPPGTESLIHSNTLIGNHFQAAFSPYAKRTKPSTLKILTQTLARMKEGRDTGQVQQVVKQPTGKKKFNIRISPRRDIKGKFEGIIVAIQDEPGPDAKDGSNLRHLFNVFEKQEPRASIK